MTNPKGRNGIEWNEVFSFLFGERNQNCCAWHVLGVGAGSWRGHFGNPALEFLDLFVRTEEQVADGDATKEKARSTCSCWFAREVSFA